MHKKFLIPPNFQIPFTRTDGIAYIHRVFIISWKRCPPRLRCLDLASSCFPLENARNPFVQQLHSSSKMHRWLSGNTGTSRFNLQNVDYNTLIYLCLFFIPGIAWFCIATGIRLLWQSSSTCFLTKWRFSLLCDFHICCMHQTKFRCPSEKRIRSSQKEANYMATDVTGLDMYSCSNEKHPVLCIWKPKVIEFLRQVWSKTPACFDDTPVVYSVLSSFGDLKTVDASKQ